MRELAKYAQYAVGRRRVAASVRAAAIEWRRRRSARPLRLSLAQPPARRSIPRAARDGFPKATSRVDTVAIPPTSWEVDNPDPEALWKVHRFGWMLEDCAASPARGTAMASVAAMRDWTAHASSRNPRVLDSYSLSERLANWSFVAMILSSDNDATVVADAAIRNSIDRQASALTGALEEYGDGYTNNHFLNNLRALFWYGTVWNAPEHRRVAAKMAADGLPRLFTESGFLRESSSHYQVLLTRSLIEMRLLAQIAGDDEAIELLQPWVERVCSATALLTAGGRMPLVGDVSPDFSPDWLLGLMTVASKFTGQTTAPASCLPGWHTLWVGDERARSAPPHTGWTAHPDAGWYRLSTGAVDLLWHVNPDGAVGPRSHGHIDLGSFELVWDGRPIVIDPGRPTYAACSWDARRAASHNTIVVDGYDPMLAWGVNGYPRAMDRDYWDPRASMKAAGNQVTLQHYGFARVVPGMKVERQFTCGDRQLEIVDTVTAARDRLVDSYLHLAPDVAVRRTGPVDLQLVNSFRILNLRWCSEDARLDLMTAATGPEGGGWYSPRYGEQVPTTTIRLRSRARGAYLSSLTISERSA